MRHFHPESAVVRRPIAGPLSLYLNPVPALLKKVRLANKRALPSLRLYFSDVVPDFSATLRFSNGEPSR
jgi:hypothetical protein